ncbi:hypothetical protein VD659_00440 [Herbiconiux sp. 11R-BC]|uniref:hypothetical protein n=1 Tax=Herbiconiux sp. 11R-BC TaxID=3111637 RepID=UPI003C0CACD8
MRRLERTEASKALSWIEPDQRDGVTGLDLAGWDDSIWVLHAMYEHTGLPSDLTYEHLRIARREGGQRASAPIGTVDLDDIGIDSGITLGFTEHPGDGWRRLTWSDYFSRSGSTPGQGSEVPPCFRWFPRGSWPLSIRPPGEGSLDSESLRVLVEALREEMQGQRCAFYPAALTTGSYDDEVVYEGGLSEVFDLVGELRGFTPSNFWPTDRSWFVYTDYDLFGTRVSGSAELIAALEAHPQLETLRWEPPPVSPAG